MSIETYFRGLNVDLDITRHNGGVSDDPGSLRPGRELLTWLDALGVLSTAATADTDLRQVLDLVAQTARTLLGFDFCGVLVPDEHRRRLLIAGFSGLSEDYVDRVNSDRPIQLDSTSPSSRAFHTGTAVAVRDVTAEPQFAQWAGIAREQGYRAVIAVPLVAHNEVLGTLNGYYGPVHTFTQHGIQRMTLLANHAAIALTSASRLDELRTLNASLREQRDALRRSEQIHQRLLGVTLRSGGLDGIATTLRELIGRPVLIDDARHNVLALAGEGSQFPDSAWRTASVQDGAGSSPVLADGADDSGHWRMYASAVRLGTEIVARIWFPANDIPIGPIDARAVEHGSLVVALELLRDRTAAEVEHRLRGELLADLLSGRTAPGEEILLRAARLGHDLASPHVTMVAAVAPAAGQGESLAYERALAQVARIAAGFRPRPLVAMHRGHIVILWPATAAPIESSSAATPDPSPAAVVMRALEQSLPGGTVTVGVWSATSAPYGDSYRIANGILEIAVRSGRTHSVVSVDDLGIVGLLLQIDDSAKLDEFARRTLGPVVDYDTAHRTRLLTTLRTYLDCRRDRNATAAELVIHPNTVAQRLRRIEKLCHEDLDDPAAIVRVTAAMTVYDLARLI